MPAAEADYYEILEVSRDCDASALKKAYRKLAMRWHPDRNPGDKKAEARFKAISEAYDCLKDPQKRAAYDRYGHAAFQQGAGQGGGFGGGAPFSDIFSDIFDQFMGGGRQRRQGPARGADLRYDVEITFEEAFSGTEHEIALDVSVPCDHCNGTGGKPGAHMESCPTCHGRGQVRMQNGMFIVERPCPTCHGAGAILSDPCEKCHGDGVVDGHKTLKIRIPRGVDHGTRIRVAGEGEAAPRGGQPGDLYVFVHLAPHPIWKRDGTTLFINLPVSFVTAALGGEVTIPGIDHQPINVRIPAGTQPGRQFRIRGSGMPVLNSNQRGDLVVSMDLETPTSLSARQKELLEEFRKIEEGTENCPKSKNFWKRLKGAWEDLVE